MLSAAQEKEILLKSESQFFDFKRIQIEPAKLCRTVVAFANADGGELYVGVADANSAKGSDRLSGFENEEAANAHLQAINAEIDPPISGLEHEFVIAPSDPERVILHLLVPKSPDVHFSSDKKCYIRRGAQNLPISGGQVEALIFSKGKRSYEDTIAEDVYLSDIVGGNYIHEYLKLVPTAQPPEEFMRKLALLERHEQIGFAGPRVRVAGVLTFHDSPQNVLPTRCGVKISRLQTKDKDYKREYLKGTPETIEGPVQHLIERAVGSVKNRMDAETFEARGGYEKLRYPPQAIHEIVTNAILHRDYSVKDDIRINIYDNRIEVISPGKLPGHITPQNILEERYSRNPKIGRLMNKLPNAPNKDIGEGLKTAFRSMKEARLRDPVIEEVGNSVVVSLLHQSIASPAQHVVRLLQEKGQVRNRDVRVATGIESENVIKGVLRRLRDKGVIEPVDPNAKTFKMTYKLTRDWKEHYEGFETDDE